MDDGDGFRSGGWNGICRRALRFARYDELVGSCHVNFIYDVVAQ
jgi:hypothetical protein